LSKAGYNLHVRRLLLVFGAAMLLSGCAASIGLAGVWHFGDGSGTLGSISISNQMGRSSYFYIGNRVYGPTYHGETIIVQLSAGTWIVRDSFGHRRYVTLHEGDTVYVIFG